MTRALTALAASAAVATVFALPTAGLAQHRVRAGTLNCDVSGGIGMIVASKKQVRCIYSPDGRGPREAYIGSIEKFGLDIGATTGGRMVWAVYAPTRGGRYALAGHYAGAAAEATVGAGAGANALIGGSPHGDLAAAVSAGAGRSQSGDRRRRADAASGAHRTALSRREQ
jgi:hypothetical protein